MTPRALLSLLFNASKGLDVVATALELGLPEMLDAGPITLRELCERTGAQPMRMYKFLDCLESMELVVRTQAGDERLDATFRSAAPLLEAARAVLGPASIERDRDRYEWRVIAERLPEVLRGELSNPTFSWPPSTPEEVCRFEASMAAGCPPIVESFLAARTEIFAPRASGGGAGASAGAGAGGARSPSPSAPLRWLDVGGGDGTLAVGVLDVVPGICADVFNLPSTGALLAERARASGHEGRLRLVAGDFFVDELPGGYDVVSFVRVLHDWDESKARILLGKAARALAPGGRLVICEELRTRERLAVQFFWTYFLMGVDACESRLRDAELYLRELGALGFSRTRVLPGAFDLIVAS